MNKTACYALAIAVATALLPIMSKGADNPIVAQTLFSDGTTNTWTQADLVSALQLMNRKYHRDCERPAGRRDWHGKLVGQSVTTNGEMLVKTERHEDGTVFTFEAPYVPPAVSVSNANNRLKTTLVKGVPKALAEARLKRLQEKEAVSNITVTVTAGGNR